MVLFWDLLCYLTLVAIIFISETHAIHRVKSQANVWILANSRYEVNCSISDDVGNTTKLYWSRVGSIIQSSKTNQIQISKNIIQLVFTNATKEDAGMYICHAVDAAGSFNSTTFAHIGDIPKWNQLNCLYIPDSNKLWLFPLFKYTSEKIKYKLQACCSSYKVNHWCQLPDTIWKNATCGMYNKTTMGCSLADVHNYCPYKFVIHYGNNYGWKKVSITIGNVRENCLPEFHQPELKVDLVDVNGQTGFLVSWHLPDYDEFSRSKITVATSKDLSKPFQTIIVHKSCNGRDNQCTKKISGTNLSPCTNYTICVQNMLMSDKNHVTIKCLKKTTKNNDMPSLTQVTYVHNNVKKTLEFYWKDRMFYEKGPFFYSYELKFRVNSSTIVQNGNVFNKQSLVLSEPNCERGSFSIGKCTHCGCGEKALMSFELATKQGPSAAPRKTEKSTFPTVVVAVVCFVLLFGSVVLIVMNWRQREPLPREEPIEELDDVVLPIHYYDEPTETFPHYYDEIEIRESTRF